MPLTKIPAPDKNSATMRDHAFKQGTAVYEAADGVCAKFGQTHDIKNLFISDGSQFTTGASEKPGPASSDAGPFLWL